MAKIIHFEPGKFKGDKPKGLGESGKPADSGGLPETIKLRGGLPKIKPQSFMKPSDVVDHNVDKIVEGVSSVGGIPLRGKMGKSRDGTPQVDVDGMLEQLDNMSRQFWFQELKRRIGDDKFDLAIEWAQNSVYAQRSESLINSRGMGSWEPGEVIGIMVETPIQRWYQNPYYFTALFRQALRNQKKKDDEKMLNVLKDITVPKEQDDGKPVDKPGEKK